MDLDAGRRRTYRAVAGGGTWVLEGEDGPWQPLRLEPPRTLERCTVPWTQGYRVGQGDARRDALFDILDRGAKRVLRSWPPEPAGPPRSGAEQGLAEHGVGLPHPGQDREQPRADVLDVLDQRISPECARVR